MKPLFTFTIENQPSTQIQSKGGELGAKVPVKLLLYGHAVRGRDEPDSDRYFLSEQSGRLECLPYILPLADVAKQLIN